MSKQKSKLEYDIGSYYITDDEDHQLCWEREEPYIELAEDLLVQMDVDGEFCIVLREGDALEGEEKEQLLEKYEEQIQEAIDEMTNEIIEAYQVLFPNDKVFVDDTQFYNVHKCRLDKLAWPWYNTYILKWKNFDGYK